MLKTNLQLDTINVYKQSLIDEDDYRQMVLETILEGQHVSKEVYELRLSLFLQAADYYFKHGCPCLEPFPSCFFDQATKSRRYEDLKKHILSIPPLTSHWAQIKLPKLTWTLLRWIFTNPLEIEAVTKSPVSDYFTEELRQTTKLTSVPYPSEVCIRFDIRHNMQNSKFIDRKLAFGSFFGYHGSPAQNFHSIIHRGLICALNKNGAYGYGTYLTSSLDVAKQYSNKHLRTTSNSNDLTGRRCCVAIVEVINDPSIKLVNFSGQQDIMTRRLQDDAKEDTLNQLKYYVVANDELMRLRHLLVFD